MTEKDPVVPPDAPFDLSFWDEEEAAEWLEEVGARQIEPGLYDVGGLRYRWCMEGGGEVIIRLWV